MNPTLLALVLLGVQQEDAQPPASRDVPPAEAPRPELTEAEEIVVTGSRTDRKRADSTATVDVIDRSAIEASGAETVADILEAQPGVDLDRGLRGFSVRMQGLDPEYVLVLVDGERAQGRLGGSLDLSRFPLESVDHIEIVKGAGSALYGSDAVAGVINIITRRPKERLETGGRLSGGTLGVLDASYRLGLRRESFEVMAIAGHHRGAAWDLSPGTPDTTGSAFRTSDLTLTGAWRRGTAFRLGAKTEYLRRNQTGVGSNETGAIFDRQTQSEQASATVEPDWRFAGGSRLRLTGHYALFIDQFLSDQRGATALDLLQKTSEHMARLGIQHDWAVASGHLFTSGAEVLYERMFSPRMSGGAGSRTRGSLFGQHEWRVLEQPRVALLPGVRLDADSQFGLHASPKVAARFDPHDRLAFRAAYGWGYRAPSFQELYLQFENPGAGYQVSGNPDLRPERSAGINLDLEWRPLLRARLALGAFRSDIRDLIITRVLGGEMVGVISRFGYENVAEARTQGLEAGAGAELFRGLRADVSYTLTLARDLEEDRPLEGRARHRGTFRLGYRHERLGLQANARGSLVGSRPFYRDDEGDGVIETVNSDPHASLGLRFEKVIWQQIEAFVGADNLLGAGDELYLPIAPRAFYGGLDFRY
jgi:outer membrane receptor for ferrienterochelin and colicins